MDRKKLWRLLFLMFLCTAWIAILMAAPLAIHVEKAVHAHQKAKVNESAKSGVRVPKAAPAAGASRRPEHESHPDGWLEH